MTAIQKAKILIADRSKKWLAEKLNMNYRTLQSRLSNDFKQHEAHKVDVLYNLSYKNFTVKAKNENSKQI